MENLGIDIKLLIAQFVNFVLFFIIVKKFIVKPFMLFLNQEKKHDKEKEEALVKIKKTEESLLNEQIKAKVKSRAELDMVLEQAKKDSQLIKQAMIVEAQKEAEEIKERMKKQLEDERDGLYKDIKEQIVKISLNLVSDGIKDALDESDKAKITKRMLKNLSERDFIKN